MQDIVDLGKFKPMSLIKERLVSLVSRSDKLLWDKLAWLFYILPLGLIIDILMLLILIVLQIIAVNLLNTNLSNL